MRIALIYSISYSWPYCYNFEKLDYFDYKSCENLSITCLKYTAKLIRLELIRVVIYLSYHSTVDIPFYEATHIWDPPLIV